MITVAQYITLLQAFPPDMPVARECVDQEYGDYQVFAEGPKISAEYIEDVQYVKMPPPGPRGGKKPWYRTIKTVAKPGEAVVIL